MPLTYRNYTTNASTVSGTSFNVSRPASTVDGDIIICQVAFSGGSGVVVTPPSGFVLINRTDSSTDLGLAIFYKFALSEPSFWTFSLSSSQKWGQHTTSYGGANSASPINGTPTSNTTVASGSTSKTFSSITPAAIGGYVFKAFANLNTSSPTISNAGTGYTARGFSASSSGSPSPNLSTQNASGGQTPTSTSAFTPSALVLSIAAETAAIKTAFIINETGGAAPSTQGMLVMF